VKIRHWVSRDKFLQPEEKARISDQRSKPLSAIHLWEFASIKEVERLRGDGKNRGRSVILGQNTVAVPLPPKCGGLLPCKPAASLQQLAASLQQSAAIIHWQELKALDLDL